MDIKVIEYITQAGANPYRDWLRQLDGSVRFRVQARIMKLVDTSNFGEMKNLGNQLFELKFKKLGGAIRVYYGLKNKSLVKINEKLYKIPELILNENVKKNNNASIKEALYFNKNILIENFIEPNRLRFPYSRNILEKYFN